MAKSILLEVITPSKLFYKGEVELVICRTLTGDEGFMANHSWACKLLDVGELWIQEAGAKDFRVAAIAGGYVDVKDYIVIYTDAAEWSGDTPTSAVSRTRLIGNGTKKNIPIRAAKIENTRYMVPMSL